MFAVRKNKPVDLHNDMARYIKPAAEKLGLPRIGWHDLRHTSTTWGRINGIKPEILRDQLGHADIQTILGIYSHASQPEARVEAARLIGEYAMGGATKTPETTVM